MDCWKGARIGSDRVLFTVPRHRTNAGCWVGMPDGSLMYAPGWPSEASTPSWTCENDRKCRHFRVLERLFGIGSGCCQLCGPPSFEPWRARLLWQSTEYR